MSDYTFLKKFKSGEAVYGLMAFEFMTPGLLSIVKACGVDFLIFDTEHSGFDIKTIKQQVPRHVAFRSTTCSRCWELLSPHSADA